MQTDDELIIKVVDSHENLPDRYWKRLGRFYAKEVWGTDLKTATARVRDLFYEYELEYAVKWYEITALCGEKIVGNMRILRSPDDRTRWYFCDVHTAAEYRRRGVASCMYRKALAILGNFYATECVQASISAANTGSIRLHEKLGFSDTGRKSEFANFLFEEDETMYELPILCEFPVAETRITLEQLNKYMIECGHSTYEEIPADAVLVFCGEKIVAVK